MSSTHEEKLAHRRALDKARRERIAEERAERLVLLDENNGLKMKVLELERDNAEMKNRLEEHNRQIDGITAQDYMQFLKTVKRYGNHQFKVESVDKNNDLEKKINALEKKNKDLKKKIKVLEIKNKYLDVLRGPVYSIFDYYDDDYVEQYAEDLKEWYNDNEDIRDIVEPDFLEVWKERFGFDYPKAYEEEEAEEEEAEEDFTI